MAMFDPKDASSIMDFVDTLPKDVVVEYEPHAHCTVLFGLLNQSAEPLQVQLSDYGPLTFTLGAIGLFENEEYTVLKIGVEGKQIHELHHQVTTQNDFVSDYAEYRPHCTIGYLRCGEGREWDGDTRFAGQEITVTSLIFSNADKEKTVIKLCGASAGDVIDRLIA